MGGSEGPVALRPLRSDDPATIAAALSDLGWNGPASRYERFLREQAEGECEALVAELDGSFAGHVVLRRRAAHGPFARDGIPEIRNLVVLPPFRRRGVATALLDRVEAMAAAWNPRVGIGFGADRDYGAAQVLYVRRGYVPDGTGVTSHGRPLVHGDVVTVDDDLVLHLVKELGPTRRR